MLKQLNNLLQRLTGYRLEYHGRKDNTVESWTCLPGNNLIGIAYTASTDPCQDGNYLIGKYA